MGRRGNPGIFKSQPTWAGILNRSERYTDVKGTAEQFLPILQRVRSFGDIPAVEKCRKDKKSDDQEALDDDEVLQINDADGWNF